MLCFQAEYGIRDLVRSRGLGDVYKRQGPHVGAGRAGPLVGTRSAQRGGQHELLADTERSLSLIHI